MRPKSNDSGHVGKMMMCVLHAGRNHSGPSLKDTNNCVTNRNTPSNAEELSKGMVDHWDRVMCFAMYVFSV